ncbi:MAG: electron transport complex subunit RsxE, partial [Treponemataceae bacterium]
LGMGAAMIFVIVMSEIIISLCKKIIPSGVRIPIFIIVIASFTTIVDLLMQAYLPSLSKSLGVFIPLIVVNCIIMGRVESFASKQSIPSSILDALGMGIGYTWVLVGISFVRELVGTGTLFDMRIIPEEYTIGFFSAPPGGFFVFGLFISLNMLLKSCLEKKKSSKGVSA